MWSMAWNCIWARSSRASPARVAASTVGCACPWKCGMTSAAKSSADRFVAAGSPIRVPSAACSRTAGLIPQPLHLVARHFWRADDTGTRVVDDVDHLVDLIARHGHLRERRDLLEIVEPRLDSESHVGARL